ncbi:MAG: Fur family transcriptional regulator [Oligoflexales bacterium]
MSIEQCKRKLKEAGSRVTKSRLAVWQILANQKGSASPAEIFELISADRSVGSIDQVTVYRILDTFLEIGLVHKVGPTGKFILCEHVDCQRGMHVLARCHSCSQIEEWDAPEPITAPMMWYLKEKMNFLPKGHLVEVDGICGKCQNGSYPNCN